MSLWHMAKFQKTSFSLPNVTEAFRVREGAY